MTISTEHTPLSYNGDGSTVNFAITWKYFAKSHVVATLRSAAGVETVWALTTNYTLTAAGVEAGGTLTAVVAPATGEKLVITLEPPNTQDASLPLGGAFPSPSVEDGLDLSAQRDSKFKNLLNRTFRVPVTDTQSGSNLEFPIDSSRASKYLSFDANGKPIAIAGTTNTPTVSSFMETVLDDASAAAARTTLGLGTSAVANLAAMPATTMAGLLTQAAGTDIASAATVDLTAATGNSPRITGTVATSAFTMNAGQQMWLIADGAWPLTHNATTNNIVGGASITLAAGARVFVFKDLSGIIQTIPFKADGTAVAGGTAPVFGRVVRTAGDITTTSTTLIDLTGATVTFTTGAFPCAIGGSIANYSDGAGRTHNFNIDIDGGLELGTTGLTYVAGNVVSDTFAMTHQSAALTAASHTIKVQWKVSAGTGTVNAGTGTPYSFWAHEIR